MCVQKSLPTKSNALYCWSGFRHHGCMHHLGCRFGHPFWCRHWVMSRRRAHTTCCGSELQYTQQLAARNPAVLPPPLLPSSPLPLLGFLQYSGQNSPSFDVTHDDVTHQIHQTAQIHRTAHGPACTCAAAICRSPSFWFLGMPASESIF